MDDALEFDADAPGMTTGAVARRLGVAPTTLRSWDRRYGIGPAVRHDGRHRRWTRGDIAVLEHMCRLTGNGIPPAEAARQARAAVPDPHPATEPDTDPGAGAGSGSGPRSGSGHASGSGAGADPGPAPGAPAASVPEARTGSGRSPASPAPTSGPFGAGAAPDASEAGPAPRDGGDPAGQPGLRPAAADTADRPGGGRHGPGGSNALPLGSVRKECRGLANAAVRLDAPALDARLEAAITEHGLLVAWDEVIMPALRAVGRKWASSGERYVEVEHLLSWHISSVLRRVAVSSPVNTDRPPVLLACVPNEMHSLPLEALAAGLAQRGLPVRMFGAAVPAEALDEAVRRTGPAAVVLWSQSRGTADGTLARQIQATAWGVRGARLRPALLLAGPGWAGAGRVPRTARPRSLAEALDSLAALGHVPDRR